MMRLHFSRRPDNPGSDFGTLDVLIMGSPAQVPLLIQKLPIYYGSLGLTLCEGVTHRPLEISIQGNKGAGLSVIG